MTVAQGSRVPTARAMMDGAPERGLLDVGGLGVEVRVVDVRTVYGRVQYLVEPVAGRGRRWVDAARVARVEAPDEDVTGPGNPPSRMYYVHTGAGQLIEGVWARTPDAAVEQVVARHQLPDGIYLAYDEPGCDGLGFAVRVEGGRSAPLV